MSWTSKAACEMLASSGWKELRHNLQKFLLVSRLGDWHIPSPSDLTRLTQDQQAAGQCLLTPNPVHSPWPPFYSELQCLPLLSLHQVLIDDLSPPVTVVSSKHTLWSFALLLFSTTERKLMWFLIMITSNYVWKAVDRDLSPMICHCFITNSSKFYVCVHTSLFCLSQMVM